MLESIIISCIQYVMIIVINFLCVHIYYNGPFPQCKLVVVNQGHASDLKSWYYSPMTMNIYVDMHETKNFVLQIYLSYWTVKKKLNEDSDSQLARE